MPPWALPWACLLVSPLLEQLLLLKGSTSDSEGRHQAVPTLSADPSLRRDEGRDHPSSSSWSRSRFASSRNPLEQHPPLPTRPVSFLSTDLGLQLRRLRTLRVPIGGLPRGSAATLQPSSQASPSGPTTSLQASSKLTPAPPLHCPWRSVPTRDFNRRALKQSFHCMHGDRPPRLTSRREAAPSGYRSALQLLLQLPGRLPARGTKPCSPAVARRASRTVPSSATALPIFFLLDPELPNPQDPVRDRPANPLQLGWDRRCEWSFCPAPRTPVLCDNKSSHVRVRAGLSSLRNLTDRNSALRLPFVHLRFSHRSCETKRRAAIAWWGRTGIGQRQPHCWEGRGTSRSLPGRSCSVCVTEQATWRLPAHSSRAKVTLHRTGTCKGGQRARGAPPVRLGIHLQFCRQNFDSKGPRSAGAAACTVLFPACTAGRVPLWTVVRCLLVAVQGPRWGMSPRWGGARTAPPSSACPHQWCTTAPVKRACEQRRHFMSLRLPHRSLPRKLSLRAEEGDD